MLVSFASAGVARATITASQVTAPANGTLLADDEVSSPGQTMTASGNATGTGEVSIDCYVGGQEIDSYSGQTGSGFQVTSGTFSASVPLSTFSGSSCVLLAVPYGVPAPSHPTAFTGPRVAVSLFKHTTVAGTGINAGDVDDFKFVDATLSGVETMNSIGDCGPQQELIDSSTGINGSPYGLDCGGSLRGAGSDFEPPPSTTPDLGRSEIELDGANAYGSYDAAKVANSAATAVGLPPLTASLDRYDNGTGDAQTTERESLVECSPDDAYDEVSSDCTSFEPTGVLLTRVASYSQGGRVATVSDTFASIDGKPHSLDVEYEDDVSAAAGWKLPGQDSFTVRQSGTSASAPPGGLGSIYALDSAGSAPSLSNPVSALTFASPYSKVSFDGTLFDDDTSALIDYKRTIPAGDSITIAWSYAAGTSLGEVQNDASEADDVFQPPAIAIDSPPNGTTFSTRSTRVSGTAGAGSGVGSVTVNGIAAPVESGRFSATVRLAQGSTPILATLTSDSGATATATETLLGPVAPVVTTGPASAIGDRSATLTGRVTAGSDRAPVYFEWGTGAGYGHVTRPHSLSPRIRAVSVSARISGLSADKTYHYRLVASNAAGTGDGAGRTFRTLAAPQGLTVTATPRSDRRPPYRYIARGRLELPAGVKSRTGCRGAVIVTVKRGAKPVSRGRTDVIANCTWTRPLRFTGSELKGAGKLTISAMFTGNEVLGASLPSTVNARYG